MAERYSIYAGHFYSFGYVDDVTVQSGNTVNGNLTLYDLSNGLTLYNATLTIEDDSIVILPMQFSRMVFQERL